MSFLLLGAGQTQATLPPVPLGTLFDVDFSTLANLNDFTVVNPNTILTLTGGYLRVQQTPGTGNFNNYIRYNAYGSSNLEVNEQEILYIPRDLTATSYGVSLSMQRTQSENSSVDFIGFLELDSGSNKGLLAIYDTSLATITTSGATKLIFSVNDQIIIKWQRNKNVITLICQNIDTPNSVTLSYTVPYSYPQSPQVFPALIGKPTIYFSGGTADIAYFKYSSTQLKNAHVTYYGDSVTWGYGTTAFTDRYPDKIMTGSPKTYNVCGSPGANTAALVQCLNEMTLLNSTYNFICIGINDQATSVPILTSKANLQTLLAGLPNTKIVTYLVPFLTNDPATWNAMIDTIATGPIPDLTTILGTGTPKYPNPAKYVVDLIHPNDIGSDDIGNEALNKYPSLI